MRRQLKSRRWKGGARWGSPSKDRKRYQVNTFVIYFKSCLSVFLFLCFCLSLSVCVRMCMCVQYPWSIEDAFKSPEPGAAGGLDDVGTGSLGPLPEAPEGPSLQPLSPGPFLTSLDPFPLSFLPFSPSFSSFQQVSKPGRKSSPGTKVCRHL